MCILKRLCGVSHVIYGVLLECVVLSLLFEDVDDLFIGGIERDAVDDWEGEFAFGDIFAKALVIGVLLMC